MKESGAKYTKESGIKPCWYSEINCGVCVKGISKFLQDKLKDVSFNIDEFITDSEEIQEIRGWLWETHENNLCNLDACSERHYHKFKPELDNIIKNYCQKYGLSINVD
jgi:hypothetical protein